MEKRKHFSPRKTILILKSQSYPKRFDAYYCFMWAKFSPSDTLNLVRHFASRYLKANFLMFIIGYLLVKNIKSKPVDDLLPYSEAMGKLLWILPFPALGEWPCHLHRWLFSRRGCYLTTYTIFAIVFAILSCEDGQNSNSLTSFGKNHLFWVAINEYF